MTMTLHYNFAADKSLAGRIGPLLGLTRITDASYFDSAGVRQIAASGVARFDHLSAAPFTSLGLLIEDSRTNLFLNSDAPVTQGVTTTAQSYTVWMEGAGSVTLSGSGSGVATDGSPIIVVCTAGTLTLTVAGGPDLVQLEAGASKSSYIPTLGASVTRNADNITSGAGQTFAQTDGAIGCTLYTESSRTSLPLTTNYLAVLSRSSPLDLVRISASSTNRISTDTWSAGVSSGSVHAATGFNIDGSPNRTALRVATNDLSIYLNGNEGTKDTVLSYPAGIDTLRVGSYNGTTNMTNGHVAEVRYYDEGFEEETLDNMSNGIFPGGLKNFIAVTRRTASQLRPKQRMQSPKPNLRDLQ